MEAPDQFWRLWAILKACSGWENVFASSGSPRSWTKNKCLMSPHSADHGGQYDTTLNSDIRVAIACGIRAGLNLGRWAWTSLYYTWYTCTPFVFDPSTRRVIPGPVTTCSGTVRIFGPGYTSLTLQHTSTWCQSGRKDNTNINTVFAENLVGLGLLHSVSYIKSIPTHENYLLWKKSGPNATFNLFFLGLGWSWVGEFVGFITRIICLYVFNPTEFGKWQTS